MIGSCVGGVIDDCGRLDFLSSFTSSQRFSSKYVCVCVYVCIYVCTSDYLIPGGRRYLDFGNFQVGRKSLLLKMQVCLEIAEI